MLKNRVVSVLVVVCAAISLEVSAADRGEPSGAISGGGIPPCYGPGPSGDFTYSCTARLYESVGSTTAVAETDVVFPKSAFHARATGFGADVRLSAALEWRLADGSEAMPSSLDGHIFSIRFCQKDLSRVHLSARVVSRTAEAYMWGSSASSLPFVEDEIETTAQHYINKNDDLKNDKGLMLRVTCKRAVARKAVPEAE